LIDVILIRHFKYLVQLQVNKSNDSAPVGTDVLPKAQGGTLVNESVVPDAAGTGEKLVEANGPTSPAEPPADSSNSCLTSDDVKQ